MWTLCNIPCQFDIIAQIIFNVPPPVFLNDRAIATSFFELKK